MEIVRDFEIITDKESVLKAIASYFDLSKFTDLDKTYSELEGLAMNIIKPMGYYLIDKMPLVPPCGLIQNCENIVYCLLTIGDQITERTEEFFDTDELGKGIILDAISTSILFNLSKQLYERVFTYTKEKKLGLTCRIAPGDGEIDITYQKDIVLKFEENKEHDFKIVNDYLIKPYKSITYIFGAGRTIEVNREDHKCDKCHNVRCFMRNSSEKIRGPFEN